MSTRRILTEVLDSLPDERLQEVLTLARVLQAKEGRHWLIPTGRHALARSASMLHPYTEGAKPETD